MIVGGTTQTEGPGSTETVLYYRATPDLGSLVFAPPDRAVRGSEIRRAFESKTWGQFQDRMPPADFAALFEAREIYDELFIIPARGDPFIGENIWVAWADGDYPEWLQGHQGKWLPKEILDEWGFLEATRLNGDFWIIDAAHEAEIVERLAELQIRAERRDDLYFF